MCTSALINETQQTTQVQRSPGNSLVLQIRNKHSWFLLQIEQYNGQTLQHQKTCWERAHAQLLPAHTPQVCPVQRQKVHALKALTVSPQLPGEKLTGLHRTILTSALWVITWFFSYLNPRLSAFPLTCADLWVFKPRVAWNPCSALIGRPGFYEINYLETPSDLCQQKIRWSWTQRQDKLILMITKCVPLSNALYNLLKVVRKLWVHIPFHRRRCNNFGSSFIFPICCNLAHVLRTWRKKKAQNRWVL